MALLGSASTVAWADCSVTNTTVTCSGVPTAPPFLNNFSSADDNLVVDVLADARMNAVSGGHALGLTGKSIALSNLGTINPALRGPVPQLTGGVVVGNGAASSLTIVNAPSGAMWGTGVPQGSGLASTDGLALYVRNGLASAGGTTSITNRGRIDSTAVLVHSMLVSDVPVIAVQGGGRVDMVNDGTLYGRVAFSSSTSGNTFVNSGEIMGSVGMGASSKNSFTAVTGSSVVTGGGTATELHGPSGTNLVFAPTGQIDGGAGGSNTLILQGTASGTVSSDTYVNFQQLMVNSGTWTLQGLLVSGATTLKGGVARFSDNAAFGAGVLTSDGGTIAPAVGALVLGNPISLDDRGLTVQGASRLTLNGAINGPGSLTKSGAANLTLASTNSFTGGTILTEGTLILGRDGALGSGKLTVAGASFLDSSGAVNLVNAVALDANLTHVGGRNLSLGGGVSGAGQLHKNGSANLTLNNTNTFSGGTFLNAGTLTLGAPGALGSGTLTVSGPSTLDNSAPLTLQNDMRLDAGLSVAGNNRLTLDGVIAGASSLTKNGQAVLVLDGDNTFTGPLNIVSGRVVANKSGALGNSSAANISSGARLDLQSNASLNVLTGRGLALIDAPNSLNLGGNNASSDFEGALSGSGKLNKLGTGTLTLSGSNSLTGDTTVHAGTLHVTGALASANVQVDGGATLGGTGTLTGTVAVADGGHMALAGASTLTVGALVLGANSHLDASLGAPVAGGGTALLKVNGSLTLGGTLHVTDAGSFGVGMYRLIDYAGILVPGGNAAGLAIGGIPSGFVLGDLQLQTATSNQVNLMVSSATTPGGNPGNPESPGTPPIQFWNGGKTQADGTIVGGSGVWGPGSHWANVNGTQSQAGVSGAFVVFQGRPGDVTVQETQAISGLQFMSDYRLLAGAGGQLELLNAGAGGTPVRVDPGATATMDVPLAGNGILAKLDSGTLVLNGPNAYTGGTALQGGTLVVGHDRALGTGRLTVAGAGTLESKQSVDLSNAITLQHDLNVGGSGDLRLSGNVQGPGLLTKQGSGTLVLSGTNSYTGGTSVTAGTLRAGSSGALVARTDFIVAAGATLDMNGHALQASSLRGAGTVALGAGNLTVATPAGTQGTFDGQLQGSGQLIKQGDGTLALNGASTVSGGVALKQGSIALGNAQGLGSGTLFMDDGTTLRLTADGMTIANRLHMTGSNDPIIDTDAHHATWAGAITGAGFLTKQGTGTLALTHSGNTYTGATQVAQGVLLAAAHDVLSHASAHSVASGASLQLAGYNQTIAGLDNSGTVSLHTGALGAAPGATLTVTGPYVGNNGHLSLSTVLGGTGSATDRLLLSGPDAVASGRTTMHIANAGGLGAPTTGAGIEVVATRNGASLQPGAFVLADGHVDAGAYEYRLLQTAQGASLQSSTTATVAPAPPVAPTTPGDPLPPAAIPTVPVMTTYRAEVPLLAALPAQLRQADNAMLGDMRKRMGDETAHSTLGSVGSESGHGRRIWGRVLRVDPRIQQQGTVNPQSRGHLAGFQAGLDLYADASLKAGIYVGQLDGDMGVSGFASGVEGKSVGFNKLTSRYLGVYGTWQHGAGLYADAVLQRADYRSDLRVGDNSASARTEGRGWQGSLEVGKIFALGRNWQIEPQAQLVYRKLSLDDTQLEFTTVGNRADHDWTLRLGARIKGSFSTSAGVLQPYGRINIHKSSNTTDVARFVTPAATTDIQSKGGYTATETAVGASLRVNRSTSIHGDVGKLWANGGPSRVKSGVQASMGVKVLW